jgi:hypothetical protein
VPRIPCSGKSTCAMYANHPHFRRRMLGMSNVPGSLFSCVSCARLARQVTVLSPPTPLLLPHSATRQHVLRNRIVLRSKIFSCTCRHFSLQILTNPHSRESFIFNSPFFRHTLSLRINLRTNLKQSCIFLYGPFRSRRVNDATVARNLLYWDYDIEMTEL